MLIQIHGICYRALKINNEGFIGMSTHDPIRKLHVASKIQSQLKVLQEQSRFSKHT